MADREGVGRGRSVGLGILLALLLVIEVQAFAIVQAGESRAREAATADVRAALTSLLPQMAIDLARRPAPEVAQEVRNELPAAAAVALFDALGRPMAFSQAPRRDVSIEPPDDALRRRLAGTRRFVALGPFAEGRVVVYTGFRVPSRGLAVVGVAKAIPALSAELRERRLLMVLHGCAIGLLLLAGVAAAVAASRPISAPGATAMAAYEAAMAQLAARGQLDARRHATEVQRLHETLESHEAMARAGELASGIVHEVRNGLGTIAGYARIAANAAGDEREQFVEDSLRGILDECAALETVVRRFSEFVRTETLRRTPVDLRRLAERVVARLQRARPLPDVTFTGICPLVEVDEDLIERALDNLVRNAREAAGDEGHVEVRLSGHSGSVHLEIRDDGPGLAPALKGGIRPFLSTKPGGLGLGLATAIKLVRLHGGEITLQDRSPHGLTVVAELPRGSEKEAADSATNGSGPEAHSTP